MLKRSNCVAHEAVNNSSMKARGLDINGVGTVDCARHGFKRPVSMGPLGGWER